MSIAEVKAYNGAGTPLGGLTPTWLSYYNAATNASIPGSAPAIASRGDGTYHFTESLAIQAAGWIDLGATAHPRYVFYAEDGPLYVFPAYATVGGGPVSGLTPTWSVCDDRDTNANLLGSAPVISAVGGGMYKFTIPATVSLTGFISLGAGATPSYEAVETLFASVGGGAPTISGFIPLPGSVPSELTPITFSVSSPLSDLAMAIVSIKYAGFPETFVIFDNTKFDSPFATTSSRTVASTTIWAFSILPLGGWRGDIEAFTIYALNVAGALTVSS